jgi:hypothetical protein
MFTSAEYYEGKCPLCFTVLPGSPIVGEEGPELFTAPTSGEIIPNDRLRAHLSPNRRSINPHAPEVVEVSDAALVIPAPYADVIMSTRNAVDPCAAGVDRC